MESQELIEFTLPEWAKNANIYEVNIRQYTQEGTFLAFQGHLPRLKAMGVDILWFMPIFPISVTKKKGSLGSYYAVSDFRKTNPAFGTISEFKSVIDTAHSLGMKVILDWVPNHTGWDHVWIKEHPEFYSKDSHGNITDPLTEHGTSMGWDDVADLNFKNQDMRAAMVGDMVYWLENYGIDGFRHDMAMLVPLDFWKETIPKLRAVRPDLFLLAESEVHDHLNHHCFHAVYSWSLHHIMNDIAKGVKNVSSLDQWMTHDKPKAQKGLYLNFTSNHDENSWSGSEIERMGEAHKAFAILVNTIDGIPLTYSGQEEPMPRRLEFFEKDEIRFKYYFYNDFYKTLNELRHQNEAMWHGAFGGKSERIMQSNHIYSFTRQKNNQKVTVIINLSKQFQIIEADRDIAGIDVFTNKSIVYHQGEKISLMPWEYVVLSS
jgi:alpha-amylase